ncbi:hypothetical protein DERF_009569 [Dermatophagoides farinae]|uniref:Uncharacterized protein n=1 Tax=Dermatophagoides farinae TaxID=6954 RepID=A0A922HWN8_DERFA|nr:hypothetical protein DERF_009569 [Dermatophagoides farinae]
MNQKLVSLSLLISNDVATTSTAVFGAAINYSIQIGAGGGGGGFHMELSNFIQISEVVSDSGIDNRCKCFTL